MSEPRSYRVEAVVLRHSDWGEADRLLSLYTRERGKLRVVAKGARRIKSRKAGHLEPFTRVTLQLARGRDLPIVTQADTVDAYLPLRDALIKTGYAAYVAELLDRFTYEDQTENVPIYHLLTDTLGRVASEPDAWVAIRWRVACCARNAATACRARGRSLWMRSSSSATSSGATILERSGRDPAPRSGMNSRRYCSVTSRTCWSVN
jgi:hypothetical protein